MKFRGGMGIKRETNIKQVTYKEWESNRHQSSCQQQGALEDSGTMSLRF